MKRFYTILYIAFCCVIANAQPSAVKKAAKSAFELTTYSADGTVLSKGYGVFTDADGTAISAWSPFVGASKAVVTDSRGNTFDVECLYGASEIYNVAKLKVRTVGKSSFVPAQLEEATQTTNSETWYVGGSLNSLQFKKFSPFKIETFMGDLPYYIYEQENAMVGDSDVGSPFFNTKGQLMGLVNTSKQRTDLYVASAKYAITLAPNALSSNDNALRKTNIRIALPKEYSQALLALMLASQRNDSINYPATLEEFIATFPEKEDGYIYKANYLTEKQDFAGADEAMVKALEVSEQKENTHYSYSRLIYNKEVLLPDVAYEPWSLDKSLDEINAAIAINPMPLYRIHKGKIYFSKQQYAEALAEFEGVAKDGFRESDVYYFAYQCMKSLNNEKSKQLEMLDSAIVINPNEMLYQAEKALLLIKMGNAPECIALCQNMVTQAPQYAEGHGLLGLALCMCGKQEVGLAELRRAKALGYKTADALIEKYSQKEAKK